ncbi:hypothetical protein MAR_016791, partial [Mya arenaria]
VHVCQDSWASAGLVYLDTLYTPKLQSVVCWCFVTAQRKNAAVAASYTSGSNTDLQAFQLGITNLTGRENGLFFFNKTLEITYSGNSEHQVRPACLELFFKDYKEEIFNVSCRRFSKTKATQTKPESSSFSTLTTADNKSSSSLSTPHKRWSFIPTRPDKNLKFPSLTTAESVLPASKAESPNYGVVGQTSVCPAENSSVVHVCQDSWASAGLVYLDTLYTPKLQSVVCWCFVTAQRKNAAVAASYTSGSNTDLQAFQLGITNLTGRENGLFFFNKTLEITYSGNSEHQVRPACLELFFKGRKRDHIRPANSRIPTLTELTNTKWITSIERQPVKKQNLQRLTSPSPATYEKRS